MVTELLGRERILYSLHIADVQALVERERSVGQSRALDWHGQYHTLAEVNRDKDRLRRRYGKQSCWLFAKEMNSSTAIKETNKGKR